MIFVSVVAALVCIAAAVILGALGALRGGGDVTDAEAWRPVAPEDGSPPHVEELSDLERLYFRHLYHREEGATFGMRHQFRVSYFLDLMEASLVERDREILVDALTKHIQAHGLPAACEVAIGPKRGNALLIADVAHALELDPVLIKTRPLFNRQVEGLFPDGATAILIDDVSSDGELLADCVDQVRSIGLRVQHAFVLVDRVEGDAVDLLRSKGVALHALGRYSDAALAQVAHRARVGS